MGQLRNAYTFRVESLKVKDHLGNTDVDRILLKRILKKYGGG
jgi:hypothetical protein